MCDTRNAKSELLNTIKDQKIICAKISVSSGIGYNKDDEEYTEEKEERESLGLNTNDFDLELKDPHTEEELDEFLDKLDLLYDSGYGSVEITGTVWLENYVWLTRGEYDGSEWWDLNVYPDIPKELKNAYLEREININKIEN